MGKKRRKRKGAEGGYVRQQYGVDVDPAACQNSLMLRYYREQKIVPEDEWEAFETCLRTSLPMVLRVLQTRPGWENNVVEVEQQLTDASHSLSWVPNRLAWELPNAAYTAERRRWCQQQARIGTTTFQEAVSMVPALLLAPMPHHIVLDMCAAPGSKTMQLLDQLHSADKWTHDVRDSSVQIGNSQPAPHLASGMVIAADISGQKVTNIMAGRLRKLHSPCLALCVGNSKNFPFCRQPPLGEDVQRGPLRLEDGVMFDRILCDVPCSGDATIRKQPSIWRSWDFGFSMRLHKTQLLLLRRGLRLLKPGGILVYSTCSFNPIENEAVVLAALRALPGRIEVCPIVDQLPGLKRSPGLTSWVVGDPRCSNNYTDDISGRAPKRQPERRKGDWLCAQCGENVFASKKNCYKCAAPRPSETVSEEAAMAAAAEFAAEQKARLEAMEVASDPSASDPEQSTCTFSKLEHVPAELLYPHGKIRPTMFPDRAPDRHGKLPKGAEAAADDERRASLMHCMRLLPHHNDSGGFFVAVLKRTCAETARTKPAATVHETTGTVPEFMRSQDQQTEGGSKQQSNQEESNQEESNQQEIDDKSSDGDGEEGGNIDQSSVPDDGSSGQQSTDGRLFYAKKSYQLLDSTSPVWRSIASFYGIPEQSATIDWVQSLIGTTDIDGELKQLSLVSPALRRFFSGDVSEQGAISWVSLGMRAFKRLEPGYLAPAPCRWRPCHETAAVLSRLATKRRIRLELGPFQSFLAQGWLSVTDLYEMQRDGLADGLQDCGAWPELTCTSSLGGVLVGVLACSKVDVNMTRVWIAGVLTGKRIESFADKAELQIAKQLCGCD